VAAGVCGSDLSLVTGHVAFELPILMGHESAGVVEEVGPFVAYVQPGDRVITCLSVFCGRCEYCLSGRPSLCAKEGVVRGAGEPPRVTLRGQPLAQFARLGCFAERLLVHENALVKVPDELPLDVAAPLSCGLTTGLGAVLNTAKVPPGARVAVIGCGGVGLGAVQGARLAGALQIVVVDRVAERLARALELGATDAVDAAEVDPVEAVRELTGGGVDYSFEAVGRKETCAQALLMLRPAGTATIIGVIRSQTLELPGAALALERRLQSTTMGSNRFRFDIPKYAELYRQGRLKLDELVTARIGLDGLDEAFAAMQRGEGARTVVVFDGAASTTAMTSSAAPR
jgi:S-(hydroxymethyl)glutathione dehydrogenase/alcohol dehydrogenase